MTRVIGIGISAEEVRDRGPPGWGKKIYELSLRLQERFILVMVAHYNQLGIMTEPIRSVDDVKTAAEVVGGPILKVNVGCKSLCPLLLHDFMSAF
jgi:hypothetical protein